MQNPYTFPSFPNAETRQQVFPLRDGRKTDVNFAPPSQAVEKNSNPDKYTPLANQPVFGTQNFNASHGYQEMPQPQDIVQRYYHITVNEGLYYRSNLYLPSAQLPNQAIITPSITTPAQGARFINARGRGDIYGA